MSFGVIRFTKGARNGRMVPPQRPSSEPKRGRRGPVASRTACPSSCAIGKRRLLGDKCFETVIVNPSYPRRNSPEKGRPSISTSLTFNRAWTACRSVGGHWTFSKNFMTAISTASLIVEPTKQKTSRPEQRGRKIGRRKEGASEFKNVGEKEIQSRRMTQFEGKIVAVSKDSSHSYLDELLILSVVVLVNVQTSHLVLKCCAF